jgi:Sec-independent protein translocase protein TatA
MEILGIGPVEFLFVLVILLVVVGPRNLSKSARDIGRFLNRMYRSDTWRMMTETSRTLRNLPNQLAREAALEELDATQKELLKAGREIRSQNQDLKEGMSAWVEPPDTKPKKKDPPKEAPDKPANAGDSSQDEDAHD